MFAARLGYAFFYASDILGYAYSGLAVFFYAFVIILGYAYFGLAVFIHAFVLLGFASKGAGVLRVWKASRPS